MKSVALLIVLGITQVVLSAGSSSNNVENIKSNLRQLVENYIQLNAGNDFLENQMRRSVGNHGQNVELERSIKNSRGVQLATLISDEVREIMENLDAKLEADNAEIRELMNIHDQLQADRNQLHENLLPNLSRINEALDRINNSPGTNLNNDLPESPSSSSASTSRRPFRSTSRKSSASSSRKASGSSSKRKTNE